MPRLQTLEQFLNQQMDSRISFRVVISHAGLYNGPLEEPEIIFADMLRARMVLGSEVTLAGDKSSN